MNGVLVRILAVAACGGTLGWLTSGRSVAGGDSLALVPALDRVAATSVSETSWELLAKQLAEADAETCAREYEALLDSDCSRNHAVLLEAWMMRWLELDQAPAIAYVKEAVETKGYRAWHTEREVQSLLQALEYKPRSGAELGEFRKRLASNPAKALAWALAQSDSEDSMMSQFSLAIEMGYLAEVIDAVKNVRHPEFLWHRDLILRWQHQDPEAAARWLASQPESSRTLTETLEGMHGNVRPQNSHVMKLDPRFVFRLAELASDRLVGNFDRPNSTLRSALFKLAQDDPTKALNVYEKLPESLKVPRMRESLASGWAQTDGAAAMAWVEPLEDQRAYSSTLSSWVRADPAAAVAWLDQRETALTENEVSQCMEAWPEADLTESARWLASLPEDQQSAGVSHLAFRWGETDPQDAAEWLNGLEDGLIREQAVEGFARGVSEGWWENGASHFSETWKALQNLTPDEDTVAFSTKFFWRWSESDPEGAAQALMQGEGATNEAFIAVARYWGYQSPEAAAEWVSSLDDAVRDHAAYGYAMSWVVSNSHWHSMTPRPDAALPWIKTIQEKELRLGGYKIAFGAAFDLEAIDHGALTEEAQAVLADVLSERQDQGGDE